MISFRRRPQCRAGCFAAADGTAAVTGSGVIPARLPGHCALGLTPLRNSASTSARRYRGRPASLRTSGSRPRRAQLATAAEVTPNKDATCLRVIRSSPTGLPVIAAAAIPRAVGCGPSAGRPDGVGIFTFIGFPVAGASWSGQRWSPYAAAPGQGPGKIPNCPVPVALKMLLQIAARNIGQLTDIEPSPRHSPHRAGDLGGVDAARRVARPVRAAILTCCDRKACSAYRKLGVSSRSAAVARMNELGLDAL